MSDSYNTRIKLKRDTEGNWTSKNPILLDGEMIIVKTNDGKIRKKIGDGVKKFSELPYDEIAIDSATSTTSTNPVQNKVITELLNEKIGSNKPIITEPEFLTKATLKSSNITVYADPGEYTGDKGENVPGITLHGSNGTYESTQVTIGGIFTPDYNLDGRDDMAVSIYYLNKRLGDKADNTVVDKDRNKAGLMSASDKIKLDGIATGANKTTVDTSLSDSSTNPVQNKVIKSALDGKAGTAVATQSANGLLSSADKKKLDGIATGATKITVDTALSSTSTNPVQNKIINSELSGKAGTSVATTSANGLMSAADKTKLNGIATGATKITVDTALSTTSTNPVQNKAIKTELDKKADKTALDAKADVTALNSKADKTALNNKLDKTGGTLTGNLSGQYIAGTWLQTTQATDLGRVPGKIAILDESGWIYYRTPAEIKSDIGVIDSADHVVSEGSNQFWRWRKWSSGNGEMWGIFGIDTLAVNLEWHGLYYGTWMNLDSNKNGRKYPFDFIEAPMVTVTPVSLASADFWLVTDRTNNVGTALTHAPAYACMMPASATIQNPRIHYYVSGKYK